MSQVKTLKQERKKRDELCKNYFGDNHIYPSQDDIYLKYRTLSNYKDRVPFRYKDCIKQDYNAIKKDKTGRYYPAIRTKYDCDQVKGRWNPLSVNRENLVDNGVCWARPTDELCSRKYDDNEIIISKKSGRGYIWPSALRKSSTGCENDKSCEFDYDTYECMSKDAIEDLQEYRIPKVPRNWPIDITKGFIQEYLRNYYAKLLDEKPQSYMPLFGEGNRCIGYSRKKISQPQTVVNMIFKGMIKAEQQNLGTNRGLLVWHSTGSGKCMARDSLVLMYDGSVSKVQNIVVGDYVMGDDSAPRRVCALGNGRDQMYAIKGCYPGYEYVVNSEHILCLIWKGGKRTDWKWKGEIQDGNVLHIEVKDYLDLPDGIKETLVGFTTMIDYEAAPVVDDPVEYGRTTTDGIHQDYKINSALVRLQVLSGILTEHKATSASNMSTIVLSTNKMSPQMVQDVVFIARSLGMIAYDIRENETPIIKIHQCSGLGMSELKFEVISRGEDDYFGFILDGNHRYVLGDFTVTHNTCTATGVMDAFWDTDKEIVFVSSIEALASNPPEAFMKCATELFPRFKHSDVKDNISQEFEKRGVKFFTFAQLAHYLLISHPLKIKKEDEPKHRNLLKNAVLIIDEVHNIFKPLPHQRAEHFALRDFLMNYKNPATSNLYLAILTATPGDTPQEIVDLLNLVRDRKSPIIKVPQVSNDPEELIRFGTKIRGLVSYFNISSDLTKYPMIQRITPHKTPMTLTQYKKYIDVFKTIKPSEKDFDKLLKTDKLDKYYKPARKYSNTLFTWETNLSLNEFSSKIPVLLEELKKADNEKHYIYSTFFENRGYGGHGVLAIANILEKELGYEKVDFATARSINNGTMKMLTPGKKRYILAITNEIAGNHQHSTGENLQELVKLFNAVENNQGELVHVFLASQKFNEGIDFKALRNVHIFEPFLMYNKELQTVGRGARYCSHGSLNITAGEWVVKVHKYLADFPIELNEYDLDAVKQHVENIRSEISREELTLLDIKGKRGAEFTVKRNEAKSQLTILRTELVKANKQLKEINALDPNQYIMIDQKIEDDMRERLKAQTLLLLAMKTHAVDCKLFNKFHSQTEDPYNCK